MTDYFELLGLERSPVLDSEKLRSNYLQRASHSHPDVTTTGDTGQSAEVNHAFRVLVSPALRLKHLLELEGWTKSMDSIGNIGVFEELLGDAGVTIREADALVKQLEQASGAVVRAGMAGEASQCLERLQGLAGRLEELENKLNQRLQEVADHWTGEKQHLLPEVLELAMSFQFLERWQELVRLRTYTLEHSF